MLLNVSTGKCREDNILAEKCNLHIPGAPFSSSMYTSWVRFKDVVGVMRIDFFKRLKWDEQHFHLRQYSVQFPTVIVAIDLNSFKWSFLA